MKTRLLTAALVLAATVNVTADPTDGSYVRTGAWQPGTGGRIPSCGADIRRDLAAYSAAIDGYDLSRERLTVRGETLPFMYADAASGTRLYGVTQRDTRDGHRLESTAGMMVWTDGTSATALTLTVDGQVRCIDTFRAPFSRKMGT